MQNVSFIPWSRHKNLNLYASKDDRWCHSLALHDFNIQAVALRAWVEFVLAIFAKHHLQPIYVGLGGPSYVKARKYHTFRGGLKKLQRHDFAAIDNLSFVVMPGKEDYSSNYLIHVAIRSETDRSPSPSLDDDFD